MLERCRSILDTFGPRAHSHQPAWSTLKDWWLLHSARANTPNWDVAVSYEIEGRIAASSQIGVSIDVDSAASWGLGLRLVVELRPTSFSLCAEEDRVALGLQLPEQRCSEGQRSIRSCLGNVVIGLLVAGRPEMTTLGHTATEEVVFGVGDDRVRYVSLDL